jgi:hypothetical protein
MAKYTVNNEKKTLFNYFSGSLNIIIIKSLTYSISLVQGFLNYVLQSTGAPSKKFRCYVSN